MKKTGWSQRDIGRDEKRRLKRHAILSAGAKLFNDKGYEYTSLDDIAGELSITKRTIYYYVKSKEEILFECNKLGVEFINDVILKCADKTRNPIENIQLLITEYAKWVNGEFGASLVLISDNSLSDNNRAVLRKSKATLDHELRKILEEGIDDGSIVPHDTRLTASAIFGALNWIPYWNRTSSPVSSKLIASNFMSLFIDGLRASKKMKPR